MKDEYGTLLRGVFGIVLLGLPACVVDSPIAERTRSAEQEISEDASDWCADICVRLVAGCTSTACECSPPQAGPGGPPVEECTCEDDPESPGDCAESCRESMSGFVGHGEACAEAGLAAMACLDAADSCEDLDDEVEDCFHEPDDVPACNGGRVVCRQDITGGAPVAPSPGPAAGSGSSADTAGSGGAAASAPWSTCDHMFSECSDGADYLIACGGNEYMTCECFRGGSHTGTFYLPANGCSLSSEDANSGCGWNLSDF